MELVTEELRVRLPALGATESQADPLVICKFFTPDASWTWYPIEFDGDDTCFGLVHGFEEELGYFSLAELTAVRGPWGLPIERDLGFTPRPLSQVRRTRP